MNRSRRQIGSYREDFSRNQRIRHFPFQDSRREFIPRHFNPESRLDAWRSRCSGLPRSDDPIPYRRIPRYDDRNFGRRSPDYLGGPAPRFYELYAEDYEKRYSFRYRRPFINDRQPLHRLRSEEHVSKPTASVSPISSQRRGDSDKLATDSRSKDKSERNSQKSRETDNGKKRLKQKVVFMPSPDDDMITISEKITTHISYNRPPSYATSDGPAISPNLIMVKSTTESEDEGNFAESSNERFSSGESFENSTLYRKAVLSEMSAYRALPAGYSQCGRSVHTHSTRCHEEQERYSRRGYSTTPSDKFLSYGSRENIVSHSYYEPPGTPYLDEHNVYHTTEPEYYRAFPVFLKDLGLPGTSVSSPPSVSESNVKISEISDQAIGCTSGAISPSPQTFVAISVKKELDAEDLPNSTEATVNYEQGATAPGQSNFREVLAGRIKQENVYDLTATSNYNNQVTFVAPQETDRAVLISKEDSVGILARNDATVFTTMIAEETSCGLVPSQPFHCNFESHPIDIFDHLRNEVDGAEVLDLSLKKSKQIKMEKSEKQCFLSAKEDVIVEGYFIKTDKDNTTTKNPNFQESLSATSEYSPLNLGNEIFKQEEDVFPYSANEQPKTPDIVVVSVESLHNKEEMFPELIPQSVKELQNIITDNQSYLPIHDEVNISTSCVTYNKTEQHCGNGEQKSAYVQDQNNYQIHTASTGVKLPHNVVSSEFSAAESDIIKNKFESEAVQDKTEKEPRICKTESKIISDLSDSDTIPYKPVDEYEQNTNNLVSEYNNFIEILAKPNTDMIKSDVNQNLTDFETPNVPFNKTKAQIYNNTCPIMKEFDASEAQFLDLLPDDQSVERSTFDDRENSSMPDLIHYLDSDYYTTIGTEKRLQNDISDYNKQDDKDLCNSISCDKGIKQNSGLKPKNYRRRRFPIDEEEPRRTLGERGPDKMSSEFVEPAQRSESSKCLDKLKEYLNNRPKVVKRRRFPSDVHDSHELIGIDQKSNEEGRLKCSDYYKYRKRFPSLSVESTSTRCNKCYKKKHNIDPLRSKKASLAKESNILSPVDNLATIDATTTKERLENLSLAARLALLRAENQLRKDNSQDCNQNARSEEMSLQYSNLIDELDDIVSNLSKRVIPKQDLDTMQAEVAKKQGSTSVKGSRAYSKRKSSGSKKKPKSTSKSKSKEKTTKDKVKKENPNPQNITNMFECPPSPDY